MMALPLPQVTLLRYIGDDVVFLRKASEPDSEAMSQWETQRAMLDPSVVDPTEHLQSIVMSLLKDGDRPEDNPVAAWRWPQVFPLVAKVHGSKI